MVACQVLIRYATSSVFSSSPRLLPPSFLSPFLSSRPSVRHWRQVGVTPDGAAVTLRTSTVFPNGKTLELSFVGTRTAEAFGLKDVVRFERVPLEGEAKVPAGYYPIVLVASEHPALDDQSSYDVVVVREVLAETGRVLLSETITLLPPPAEEDTSGVGEAVHSVQEVLEDGSLGGVQLWRSRKKPTR